MISGSVARRYARALLAIGKDQHKDDVLAAEFERLAEVYENSPDLQVVLANPVFSATQRQNVLNSIAARLVLSKTTQDAARLLLARGRMPQLPGIARALREMVDEQAGRVRARLISAKPLDKGTEVRIRAALGRSTGKSVVLDTKEDPSLLAGIVAQVGDVVYDGSLAAQIQALRGRWSH
jgi:F-type H+-transporting ATPase subunit delta